jgi:hypothetical protein
MALFNFIERVVIPVAVITLFAGGVGGMMLGWTLVFRSSAALRFMARMNSWISTRQALKPLELLRNIEPPAGPGGRRPLLGAFLVVGGVLAVYFLLARLDFTRAPYMPGISVIRWFLTGLVLEVMKWTLVAGSAFALIVGLLMLAAPQRLAAFEARVNRWHSSRQLMSADEKMHLPLEPHVEAYPRAAGWIIGAASLLVVLAMGGLLLARIH